MDCLLRRITPTYPFKPFNFRAQVDAAALPHPSAVAESSCCALLPAWRVSCVLLLSCRRRGLVQQGYLNAAGVVRALPAAAALGTRLAALPVAVGDTPDIGELAADRRSCMVVVHYRAACFEVASLVASLERQRVGLPVTRRYSRRQRR